LDLLAGVDLRTYKGVHYSSVKDLLGAEYYYEPYFFNQTSGAVTGNINNPNNIAKTGDKINFYYDGLVNWQGGFLQGEYTEGPLTAFISLSASNTSYQRVDHFRYLDSDPARKSATKNFFGYQTKGGANYNIDANNNVFANVGYFEKAPGFSSVYVSRQNTANPDAITEKILSYELGYGYRSSKFSGNVNLYRTNWRDRSTNTSRYNPQTGEFTTINFSGVNALHQGVEVDFKYKPLDAVTINGMLSVGNWKWQNNLDKAVVTDASGNPITNGASAGPYYTKGIKVGDAPQTTASLGVDFSVTQDLKIGADYNYFGNYYASFNPTDLTTPDLKPYELPNYSLVSANAVFKFKFAGMGSSLFASVNNLLDVVYISDANAFFTNGVSDVNNSPVYLGTGRTWTVGLKFNF